MSDDILARICARKLEHVAERKRQHPPGLLAGGLPPGRPRGFSGALRRSVEAGRFGLIGEIKRASPSAGRIRAQFDPAALARAYAAGGASCLSVLTDEPFFEGADAYLSVAREGAPLPALRKDFILDPYQVLESRVIGADCVLLIMAALEDGQAAELQAAAAELGMEVLVEVHARPELERTLRLGAGLVGINNRNLKTLQVDLATTEELAPLVPPDRLVVAESGLRTHDDLHRMRRAGVSCFLVGEALMREADVTAATRRLLFGAAAGG